VTSRVQRHLRPGLADHRRGSFDLLHGQSGLNRRPLRGGPGDVFGQQVETCGVITNEFMVVQTVTNENVRPGQEESNVGSRLDLQPDIGSQGSRGPSRVHDDQVGAIRVGGDQFLNLEVVHVLPEVGANQHEAIGVLYVNGFRRLQCMPEGQLVAHFARGLALVIGRVGVVACSHRFGQMLEVCLGCTVGEECDGTRPVRFDDLTESAAYLSVGLIPAGLPKDGFTSLVHTDLGLRKAIVVLVESDPANTSRTELATAEGVAGNRADVERFAFFTELDVDAALPETHTAHGPNRIHCRWRVETRMLDIGGVVGRGGLPIKKNACYDASGPDETVEQEFTPGLTVGTHITPVHVVPEMRSH
jgi:hypothetical protein